MKKLILIIASFLLLGACRDYAKECDVITKIRLSDNPSEDRLYQVYRGSDLYGDWFYTDSLFQVGDTLCLTLKK